MDKIKREDQGPTPILCVHPVVLVGANTDGKPVGKAFNTGSVINPEKVKDTRAANPLPSPER